MFRNEEDIKKDMLDRIENSLDKSQNSFIHDAVSPAALEITNLYLILEYIENKLDVDNLEGEDLDKYINPRSGQIRKPAVRSSTIVKIEGEPGARIEVGELVGSFESTESKAVGSSGSMEVKVQSLEYGTIGNVPQGSINYFPISIPGLLSVTNENEVTNGYDEETDDSFLGRYKERIRTPATSGNKYHYLIWTKEVIGVGDVRIESLWAGPNTVKLTIIDSNKLPASLDLIEEVQEYIDPGARGLGEGQAPIGAHCTVVSATGRDIDISANISRDPIHSMEQIETKVEENIIEYLRGLAFKKNLVSYAQIGAIILEVEGVLDYTDLKVNDGVDNIIVDEDEVAVLGQVMLIE